MSLETIRYFHLNGVINGMFFSAFLMAILFLLVFLLSRRHTSLFRIIFLCTVCFVCFWLYNFYFHLLPLPMEALYPDWMFQLAKFALPIGLILFTHLFIQISVLRSQESYAAYQQLKPAARAINVLSGLALIAFIFIQDHHIVIGLTELLLMYATFVASVFCFKAIQHRMFRWLMGSIFAVGCLSFAGIAYAVFMLDVGQALFLMTLESFTIGLMVVCLSFYVLLYGYHELIMFADDEAYDWRELLSSINAAIDDEQFFLVYQPKVNAYSQTVIGVEALLRWQHPQRGLISPADFIPLSEKSYLIDTICRWVIENAVQQASEFAKQGFNLSVSMNFSVKNLHPEMVSFLNQMIEKYQVTPAKLVVEITETIFIQQTDAEKQALKMLADIGVEISLDDYGTGYSSLSTMNNLSIDELKIDRTFVSDLIENQEHRIIVESILYMTRRLGMTVVAEGVENDDILARLGDLGCEVVQGYGIAKPMVREDLTSWLTTSGYTCG